jgi:membrane protein required for colicin V production
MIWVDYCILAVFILSVIVGTLRGFTREVLGLATWAFALLISWLMGTTVADGLQQQIADPGLRLACAYAMLFLGGLLIGALITYFAAEIIQNTFLGPIDRVLGGGFGVIRAALFVAAFVLIAGTMGAQKDRWWHESMLIGKFEWLARGLSTIVPDRWLEMLEPGTKSSPSQQSS